MVGATFCRDFEEFDIVLLLTELVKNGVLGGCRAAREHDEHVHAALLRTRPDNALGKLCIVI